MKHRFVFAACVTLVALCLQQRPAAADVPIRSIERLLPQVLVVPALGAADHSVIVTASGFAPLEAVAFRFGLVDPFTGTITHPVFSVSGVADAAGMLSDRWGSVPVPPQTVPALTPAGLYMLQATGAVRGEVATTTVSLPFLLIASGLQCPARPLPPGRYGYAFADSTAAFAPGTAVAGVVGFPAAVAVEARVNRQGRLLLVFRIPGRTPPGSYALVVAGLHAGTGHQEQLLGCTLTVAAE